MTGAFPDYYQFAHPTRIVAGRGMIEGVGFEFTKEGAKRPLIVTDQGIRQTGLVEKVEAGVTGAGREPPVPRYVCTAAAAERPSAMAHTISDGPRRASR